MDYYTEADFEHIVGLPTFQDKSLLIKHVYPSEESESRTTAIIAPRRFGKTTNFRMIRHFFEADLDEVGKKRPQDAHKHYKLFQKLEIWKREKDFAEKHFGQYPVIWIDLSHYIIQSDFNAALRMLTLDMYEQHSYLANSQRLLPVEKKEFTEVYDWLENSFEGNEGTRLIKWLVQHHEQKVIMLFDELDAPMLDALLSSTQFGDTEKTALRQLFKYFHPQVKNNTYVLFTLFTGTTRIGDVASREINTLIYKSVFDNAKIASFYGYSKEDVQSRADKMGRSEKVDQMMNWYNGYNVRGSDKTIYNTLSITACLTTGVVKSFWEAGKGLDSIERLFDYKLMGKLVEESLFAPTEIVLQSTVTKYDLEVFKSIIDGKMQYSSGDAKPKNVFFQYLLEQGYYTYVENTPLEGNRVEIEVPNEETRKALQRYIYIQKFFQVKYQVEYDVINNFVACLKCLEPTQESVEKLKKAIAPTFEKQLPKNEEELRAVLYNMAYAYAHDVFHVVRAEKHVKLSKEQQDRIDNKVGRSKPRKRYGGVYIDILLSQKLDDHQKISKDNEDAGVVTIIECKCNNRDRADDALRQIIDNEYDTLDEHQTNLQGKDILVKPKLIQSMGISYHKTHGWEVCVKFEWTETGCSKTIRTK